MYNKLSRKTVDPFDIDQYDLDTISDHITANPKLKHKADLFVFDQLTIITRDLESPVTFTKEDMYDMDLANDLYWYWYSKLLGAWMVERTPIIGVDVA